MNQVKSLTRMICTTGMALTTIMVAVYLLDPVALQFLNNKTTDIIMNTIPAPQEPVTVAVVDIDESSLSKYGQWPWPRYRLAQLLKKTRVLGATSVSLAMILSEPDRTSPGRLKTTISREHGYQIDINDLPRELLDHDQSLAETLANGPFVLGFEFLFKDPPKRAQPCLMHPLKVVWSHNAGAPPARTSFFNAKGTVCNLEMFSKAAANAGFLNAAPDPDGILRRIPLMIEYDGQLFPSLTLATLMQHESARQVRISQENLGYVNISVMGRQMPVDMRGNLLVNFGGSNGKIPRISALKVLDDHPDAHRLDKKIVLIGSSASGLEPTYQAPRKPVFSHGEVHAQVLAAMTANRFIVRGRSFPLWEAAGAVLIAAVLCLSIIKLGIGWSALVGLLCILAAGIGAKTAVQLNGYVFSPFLPIMTVILNYSVLTILKTRKIQHQEKKKADEALVLLKTSESNLSSIIKTIPDIVFRLDKSGRITFISPAVTKYVDHANKLVGRPIFDLVAPQDIEKAQFRINERRTGQRATTDLELRLALSAATAKEQGETYRYFSVSAEGIYKESSPRTKAFVGTQGIARDITEQKKMEQKLQQAQKMETVGNLAAGVAHDLNNILSGLVSYPDLLLLEIPENSPLRDTVNTIQQSGQKAAAIVQDLLTFARRGVAINEVFSINTIITDYMKSPEFNNMCRNHPEVIVEDRIAADLMDVKGSPVHISKALMNVMNNAAEAMPAGGRIRLCTDNRYLDAPVSGYETIPEGEYVHLSIADEGVGISTLDLKRIFEPFFTNKAMQHSGSGLGMTVVWATIKDHEGYVDIHSEEGEGTVIELYLPVTREAAEKTLDRVTLDDCLGTERILVVDDMAEQLEIASKMLTKLGYQVTTATSGEAAVDYLKDHQADLVMLDMIMPKGMDGLETYQKITEQRPGQKAIIASGYSESERVKTLLKIGAGAYVQKPYTMEKIGLAIRRELDR